MSEHAGIGPLASVQVGDGAPAADAYLTLIERLPQPAMLAGRDGLILAMNSAGLELLEADASAAVVGKKIFAFLAAEARDPAAANYKQPVERTGRRYYDVITLKGRPRTIEVGSVPLAVSATGETELMLGLARDVTEERRAEWSQDFLAAIVRSSDDAIISLCLDLRIMSWNRGAESLLGFTAEEAIGQAPDIYIAPQDRAGALAAMREHIAALRESPTIVHRMEVAVQRKDGSVVYVSMVASGIVDSAGRLIGVSPIMRDITERKRAERERALLAAIVQSSDDAIISLSSEYRITSWNQAAERLLGFSANEAIGQFFTIHIPPELRAYAEQDIARRMVAVRSGRKGAERIEIQLQRKDGGRIDGLILASGIFGPDGTLIGVSAIISDITERKRAEHARNFLAAIVESSDDAIVGINPDFVVTGWNHGAEKLFGFTAAEAIGQPVTFYIPADMHETALRMVAALRDHPDRHIRAEVPCQRKDGSLFEVSLVGFGVRDRNQKLLGMSAIQRDITERRRAEREQALLAAIVESSEDAIITKGPDYTIRTWNAGAQRLYGYCAEEVIGRPVAILTPPDRRDEIKKVVDRVLKGEVIREYQTRRLHKEGRLIDVSLSEAPVRNAGGQIIGVAAIERDISERLHARGLEAQMAAIVKASTDAIYSLGPGHVVRTWNPGAERMFGYRAEEVIGKRSPTMVPECQGQLDEMLRHVLDGGETVEFESKRRRKDGVILDVAVTASPIYDNSGLVVGAAVVTRDITQRKRAERALIEAQNELRSRMRQQAAIARLSRSALSQD